MFDALGLPDADELLWKAQLMKEIAAIIKNAKLTQTQVAAMTNLNQSEISRLVNGNIAVFSVERLLKVLNRLGHRVELRVGAQQVKADEAQTIVCVA